MNEYLITRPDGYNLTWHAHSEEAARDEVTGYGHAIETIKFLRQLPVHVPLCGQCGKPIRPAYYPNYPGEYTHIANGVMYDHSAVQQG